MKFGPLPIYVIAPKNTAPREMATPGWQAKLREMIPSFGQSLSEDAVLAADTRARTAEALELAADQPLLRNTDASVS